MPSGKHHFDSLSQSGSPSSSIKYATTDRDPLPPIMLSLSIGVPKFHLLLLVGAVTMAWLAGTGLGSLTFASTDGSASLTWKHSVEACAGIDASMGVACDVPTGQLLAHKAFAPLDNATEPKWWTGTPSVDPQKFVIDGNKYRVAGEPLTPSLELAAEMNRVYEDVGLVLVTNTGLTDLENQRLIATLVMKKERSYDGGANPRKKIEKNVYEVGAPLEAWLHYHHEMAYIASSTKMLAFMAHKMPAKGGETFVSDNVQVTKALLATEFGQKLKRLGLCYHRNLSDRDSFKGGADIGVYNHWQLSMLTDDPEEAIAEARRRGLQAQWGHNRMLKTRFYISAYEYFPQLDRNLLYSSIADDGAWFDTWPLVQHLPPDQRPLKLTFGDGTELSPEEKKLFVKVYDDFGLPVAWKEGDIAILCNYRWAHGRPSVHLQEGEQRELGVLIGESFERVGTLDDKW